MSLLYCVQALNLGNISLILSSDLSHVNSRPTAGIETSSTVYSKTLSDHLSADKKIVSPLTESSVSQLLIIQLMKVLHIQFKNIVIMLWF